MPWAALPLSLTVTCVLACVCVYVCQCIFGMYACKTIAGFLTPVLILQKLAKQNEELDQCMAELLQTTEQAEMKDVKVKRLEGEVISLLERITQITVTRYGPSLS